jgi:RNA polymerase sigma-70 factor (ECF subfamily)
VQEVMLVVWQRAGMFDPARARLSTWIFTIARNRRIDRLRRQRLAGPEPFAPADTAPSTDGLVERSDWHSSLREALESLPSEQAEVLRWAYFEEKSHSVIAKEHGLPLGTVKSRVRLALRQLRALMEKRG